MVDTAQITARFEEPSVRAEAYWIRLTKEPTKPETVTFTEAAKVIDSIFDVDACNPNFSLSGIPVNVDTMNVEAKLREGFSLIEYEPCKFSSKNLDFIAFVYVFRSHIDETYNLVLTNGNVLRTERESMTVDVLQEITDTKYVNLEYSINGDLSCSSEVDSYSGSMITLKNKFTGFLRIKYITQFDKVKIKVYGDGATEEPVGCKCIAFYKGMATDIFIDPPEIDVLAVETIGCDDERAEEEERESLEDEDKDDSEPEEDGDEDEDEEEDGDEDEEDEDEGGGGSEDDDDDDDDRPYGTCYQRVSVWKKCMCSEQLYDSYSYAEEIPCPSPGSWNSNNSTPEAAYMNWWESRYVTLRVNCPDEKDDVADKEYFKEKCCAYPEDMEPHTRIVSETIGHITTYRKITIYPPVSLPDCKTRKRTWYGPVAFDFDAFYSSGRLAAYWEYNEEGVNTSREKLELIPVNPENASAVGIDKLICGEVITEQQVTARNCCDPEITPEIIYDDENSAEIIADNSYGTIFWEGGVPPFDLKINGQGFYLDNNRMFKSMTIASPGWTYIDDVGYWSHRVYTEDACGAANITITDGCTSASGGIRSTEGKWVSIPGNPCVLPGTTGEIGKDGFNRRTFTVISGKYKQTGTEDSFFTGSGNTWENIKRCEEFRDEWAAQYGSCEGGKGYCADTTEVACDCIVRPPPPGYVQYGDYFWRCNKTDTYSSTHGWLYSFALLGRCISNLFRSYEWKC